MINKLPENEKFLKYKAIIKYTNIAFKMIGIVLVGTFLGFWLDKKLALQFPIFTILFILLSIAGAMYSVMKEFLKK